MQNFAKMMVIVILLPLILAEIGKAKRPKKEGPRGMPINKTTSCEEFSKNARFNPHSVVGDEWFVFYYWSSPQPSQSFKFRILTENSLPHLHYWLNTHVKDFNSSATVVLMEDLSIRRTNLLVEKGNRGQYWMYILAPDLPLRGKHAQRHDLQFKQTGDNKYLAVMDCADRVAFIMSRINDVPPKAKIQDEAAKLGYRGRKGKSYLYQGHEWMPIPEMDEKTYWDMRAGRNPDINKID